MCLKLLQLLHFENNLDSRRHGARREGAPAARGGSQRPPASRVLGKISIFCKFLAGSFSAVSKRNFARKYAFDSIFQALQDLHPFAPLQSKHFRKKNRFEKTAIFVKFQQKNCKCRKICKILSNFKNFSLRIW